jgi:hypothetical protein
MPRSETPLLELFCKSLDGVHVQESPILITAPYVEVATSDNRNICAMQLYANKEEKSPSEMELAVAITQGKESWSKEIVLTPTQIDTFNILAYRRNPETNKLTRELLFHSKGIGRLALRVCRMEPNGPVWELVQDNLGQPDFKNPADFRYFVPLIPRAIESTFRKARNNQQRVPVRTM